MYLLNTTFLINKNELSWWQDWIKTQYIPQIKQSCSNEGESIDVRLYKINNSNIAPDEVSYSCQWLAPSISALSIAESANRKLTNELVNLKNESCLSFSTLMQEIQL